MKQKSIEIIRMNLYSKKYYSNLVKAIKLLYNFELTLPHKEKYEIWHNYIIYEKILFNF